MSEYKLALEKIFLLADDSKQSHLSRMVQIKVICNDVLKFVPGPIEQRPKVREGDPSPGNPSSAPKKPQHTPVL